MLGVFFAGGFFFGGGGLFGGGCRRTFVAENSTGLEDTWMRMRSFFFSVVGGIFHFDEIDVDVERDGF